jgi:hypothetical protein
MRQAKVHFNKRNIILILFIIVLSVTTFSFAHNKTVVIPLFDSESTAPEVSFCVKRDAAYDWPDNSTLQTIDFSSDSTVWSNKGGGYNTGNSRFIAPASGVYTFNGAIFFQRIAEGDMIYAAINADGKLYYGTWKYSSSPYEIVHVSVTVHLDAGEDAYLKGYVSAASQPAIVNGDSGTSYALTYFMGARVF